MVTKTTLLLANRNSILTRFEGANKFVIEYNIISKYIIILAPTAVRELKNHV